MRSKARLSIAGESDESPVSRSIVIGVYYTLCRSKQLAEEKGILTLDLSSYLYEIPNNAIWTNSDRLFITQSRVLKSQN